jgi:deazaflavin-dependent oxidoreductase (nitroreductase family)
MGPQGNPRPGFWLRLLYRLPVELYRSGAAGWESAIGLSWILLVTRGRKTGREHAVMLDLLGAVGDRYYVQAAYGEAADWRKNIEAAGEFEAQVGSDRFDARLEVCDDSEADRIMLAYVKAHPIYSPSIAWMLGYRGSLREPESVARWLVERFGMLAVVRLPEEPEAA